jgi:serine phosphatase RsbU (regulator of sigma subunit)/PAS domain-containing protein
VDQRSDDRDRLIADGTALTSQQDYLQRLAELEAAVARARPDPDLLVERAAGLIAGRAGCRIDEAHAQLRLLATEQRRGVAEVATDILAILHTSLPAEVPDVRTTVEDALRPSSPGPPGWAVPRPAPVDVDPGWAETMRQVVAAVAGNHTVVAPVRDADGQPVDFVFVAVTPTVLDMSGRREDQVVGGRVSELYPTIVDGPVWQAWKDVLADGLPREVGPIPYERAAGGPPTAPITIVVRTHAAGPGLFNSWVQPDEEARLSERLAQTERLGNLGWGEWDMLSGNVSWSEGMFRIYERDPADGPLNEEESKATQLPEDEPIRQQAAVSFGRGDRVDITYRARIGGRIKYLRSVIDSDRDTTGRPIKVYGIVQDITVPEMNRARLAEIERQLRDQQKTLAAEHRLAARLQEIILPVPQTAIELPGLQAAVRYLPAEEASRVGGDWYHTSVTRDGDIIVAIGDVAGHGIQAATTMARLRHALAALTITSTTEPAELLYQLNELLRADRATADTGSAVIARYRPGTQELVWAQAGHPPPLRTRDRRTVALDRPPGPLLGAVRAPTYGTATVDVRSTDLLLLYTDGLIEERHKTTAEGLIPVIRTLDNHGAGPIVDLVRRFRRANPDDDTCILALRPAELS